VEGKAPHTEWGRGSPHSPSLILTPGSLVLGMVLFSESPCDPVPEVEQGPEPPSPSDPEPPEQPREGSSALDPGGGMVTEAEPAGVTGWVRFGH